ncbi:hypothetical protein E2C01_070101 [Portunus trituberculatus]|uniref:Uncharacterized protein n=1 Tax=Portunus trituberculatus TaxID=210409 RepID=A0A5B7I490_PORTR|nr:hypothetical protein [Portunus trituberculatus]
MDERQDTTSPHHSHDSRAKQLKITAALTSQTEYDSNDTIQSFQIRSMHIIRSEPSDVHRLTTVTVTAGTIPV